VDIFIQDLPPDAKRIEDIPSDFKAQPLGSRSLIIEKIRRAVPKADFSDPAWGKIYLPGCHIEVNLGESDNVDGVALHVRGDDSAPGVVAAIVDALGLRALDPAADNGFFDRQRAEESFRRAYRDQALGGQRRERI